MAFHVSSTFSCDVGSGARLLMCGLRLALVSAGVAALAGCGLDEALHRMDVAEDRQHCSEYGFSPGTTAFAQCLQQQAAQRSYENQQTLNRIQLNEALDKKKK